MYIYEVKKRINAIAVNEALSPLESFAGIKTPANSDTHLLRFTEEPKGEVLQQVIALLRDHDPDVKTDEQKVQSVTVDQVKLYLSRMIVQDTPDVTELRNLANGLYADNDQAKTAMKNTATLFGEDLTTVTGYVRTLWRVISLLT